MAEKLKRNIRTTALVTTLSGFACALVAIGPAAAASSDQTTVTVRSMGTVNMKALAAQSHAVAAVKGTAAPAPEFYQSKPLRQAFQHSASHLSAEHAAAMSHAPAVQASHLEMATALITDGFDGLDHADQRNADNGNQFSLEPPDQALAVGNGFVLEAVNNGFAVFDEAGTSLTGTVANDRFFGFPSEFVRPGGPFGPSLSDPRAFYDATIKRFVVVEWGQPTDPATGAVLQSSFQMVAISKTNDPTGDYFIYQIDTSNADILNCPCIPDFQQIGLDANGLYITQNLFGIATGQFSGVSMLALSKSALAAGKATSASKISLPNDFTVHPTLVPPGGQFQNAEGGTEYFLESLADLSNDGTATAVRVFALSNTKSLSTTKPKLSLTFLDVTSQFYQQPVPATQPQTGSRPLGQSQTPPAPVEQLDGGDARFSSAPVYVDGLIWGATATALTDHPNQDGIAYFGIHVSGGADTLKAHVQAQGTISAPGGNHLTYPAIAMPTSQRGAIGVTIVGPNLLPSTAVIPLSLKDGAGTIQVSGLGALQDDGFTGYAAFGGGGVGRWGDYAAAAVDERGDLWLANEYIPARARTLLANWGTFVTRFKTR